METDILNPNATSEMSPDWGYDFTDSSQVSIFRPRNAAPITRRISDHGRLFNLGWNNRLSATARALDLWERQFRRDFFSYYHIDWGRYFSGRFTGPLQIQPAGNDKYNVKGQFEEMPGLALYQYPSNWGTDSIFLEERDGLGNDIVKLTGTWNYQVNGRAHGGAMYYSSATDATAEWLYFGYGLRLWGYKSPNFGIGQIFIDGVVIGNIDYYANPATNAQVQYTNNNLSLGWHRFKLRVTGVKNVSSTDYLIPADAIEVIQ